MTAKYMTECLSPLGFHGLTFFSDQLQRLAHRLGISLPVRLGVGLSSVLQGTQTWNRKVVFRDGLCNAISICQERPVSRYRHYMVTGNEAPVRQDRTYVAGAASCLREDGECSYLLAEMLPG